MASLWEAVGAAIGYPSLDRPTPGRRSPVWAQFCNAFEEFISAPDLLTRRGPAWLYRLLHGRVSPHRTTWRELLGNHISASAHDMQGILIERPMPVSLAIVGWNARWLVDPSANTTIAKRELISSRIARGYITCIQETHWAATDAAIWQHGLLLRNCFYSPAVPDRVADLPGQDVPSTTVGRCGGVATFLPAGHEFVQDECHVLVPGYAILTCIRTPMKDKVRVVNLYLRPGSQDRIW